MTSTLIQQFAQGPRRTQLIHACSQLIEEEVAGKKGIGGMAVKGAYKLASKLRPGLTRRAIKVLLDDFLLALEPTYRDAIEAGLQPGAKVLSQKAKVTDGLIGAADATATKISNSSIKSAYNKLRPAATRHVEAALPRVAALLNEEAESGATTSPPN